MSTEKGGGGEKRLARAIDPLWSYVSGGRIAHAFIAKDQRVFELEAACGINAVRVDERWRRVWADTPRCKKCERAINKLNAERGGEETNDE